MGVKRLGKVVLLLATASLLFAGNAAAEDSGSLKICKVGLDQATIGKEFTFTFAGQTATVVAGTESGDILSSCSQRYSVAAGMVAVTEAPVEGFRIASIRTIPPGQATLAANVATVTITAGQETTLVVRNEQIPKGDLKICKVAADAASLGRGFTFRVPGVGDIVVPAGGSDSLSCSPRIPVPAGTIAVTEVVPDGFQLVGCRTIPDGRLVSLVGNVATVTIVAGEETALVCTNRAIPPGNLELCKKAGTGVAPGTPFSFSVAIGTNAPQTVAVAAGACTILENIPAGTQVVITEASAAGTVLQSITCDPAAACVVDLANRRVTVTVPEGPGVSVEVSFTNAGPPGNLELCKVAGAGVAAGTPFTFTVKIGANAPQPVTVPAGQCAILENIPAGTHVVISETLPAGVELEEISCDPASACTIAGGIVTVVVPAGPGVAVEVTFKNKSIGELKLCKVAGEGVPAGLTFSFTVVALPNGTPSTVTVAAGECKAIGSFPNSTTVQITESVPAGFGTPTIAVSPTAELRTCPTPLPNRVCVHVSGGATTTATFTNTHPPVCTLTKGFWRNHPQETAAIIAALGGKLTIGGEALTAAQVQAILEATPNKPGAVSFAGNNLLLNLTQQVIATLLNLQGAVGLAPAEVQAAIAAVQAGIAIDVNAAGEISITSTLSQEQLSALTETLSSFNEGAFPGFAHCS